MTLLNKPIFKDTPFSSFGGSAILQALWERFDLSLLLSQARIYKMRGIPTWKLAFLVVCGFLAQCSSDLSRASFFRADTLLQKMFQDQPISQSAISRFLTGDYDWADFNRRRVARLQEDPDTALADGDIVVLDDTFIPHPYAEKMPFLYWLFDHNEKREVFTMNMVHLHVVKQSGLEYPISYAFWEKDGPKKWELARDLLAVLKKVLPPSHRLWVTMDRGYFCKDFFTAIESMEFDWVTKVKRNTTLYRAVPSGNGSKKKRFVRVNVRDLLRQHYPLLLAASQGQTGAVAIPIGNLYMKVPGPVKNPYSKRKPKPVYKPLGAVAVMNLTEDVENPQSTDGNEEDAPATYKNTFLLISNRLDTPHKFAEVYQKRWRIEVFFRNVKQNKGFQSCHSTQANHIHAHITLLYVAETLAYFTQYLSNEKAGKGKTATHGQVIRLLFQTRCTLRIRHSSKEPDTVQPYFPTELQRFASIFQRFWPERLELLWFNPRSSWDFIPSSA